MPPLPIAASRLIAPVGIASTRPGGESAPIRMMAPLPQVFSIWVMARLSAFLRSSVSLGGSAFAAMMGVLDMGPGPPRVEARIYTEAATSATRGETRPLDAPTSRPSTRYNRSDRCPTAGHHDQPNPARHSQPPPACR